VTREPIDDYAHYNNLLVRAAARVLCKKRKVYDRTA
jgi:hypothetical protein